MRTRRSGVCAGVLGVVAAGLLAASSLEEFDPPLGVYHYRFAWQGAGVAKADVEVDRDGDAFLLRVEGETGRVLDLVYRVRYRGEARIDPVDLSLIESWLEETKGRSRTDTTRLRVEDEGSVVVEQTRRKRGEIRKQETTELELEGPVLDPFAFVLMARSVDWEVGVADYFQVLVEDELWLVGLNCIEETVLDVAGERRPAWVVVPTAERLDDEEGDDEDDEPVVNELMIYVSADASRDVLAVRSETRFGTVSLELEAFTPGAARETGAAAPPPQKPSSTAP